MSYRLRCFFFSLAFTLYFSVKANVQVKDLHPYIYVENWSGNWIVPDSTSGFDQILIRLPLQPLNPFFTFNSAIRADVFVDEKLIFKGRHKQPSFVSYRPTLTDSLITIQFYKNTSLSGFQAVLSSVPVSRTSLQILDQKPVISMLSWACIAVLVLSSLARIYDQNLFVDMFNFTKPLTKESEADFLDLFTGRLPPIFLGLIFTQAFVGFASLMLSFPDSWLVLDRYIPIENDSSEWFVVLGASAVVIFAIYFWIMVVSFLFGQKEKIRFLSLNLEIKSFYVFSLIFSFFLLINELNQLLKAHLFSDYIHIVFLCFLVFKGIFILKAFSKLKPGITAVRICYICTANLVPLFVIFQYLKAH
jgi:hypothetical protein